MNYYKLSDNCIAQIVRLVQLGILTGTDVTDQLRLFEVCESKSSGFLEPSPRFLENFENNLKKLSDHADNQTDEQQITDQE